MAKLNKPEEELLKQGAKLFSNLSGSGKLIAIALLAVAIVAASLINKFVPVSEDRKIKLVEVNKSVGAYTIINNHDFAKYILADIEAAKESITCSIYNFVIQDDYQTEESEPYAIGMRLIEAKNRGVKVKVILDVTQKGVIDYGNNQFTFRFLEKNGIDVYGDNPHAMTHTKLCLFDNRTLYTGSHNYTYSAINKNNESSIRITISEEDAKMMNDFFDKLEAEGKIKQKKKSKSK